MHQALERLDSAQERELLRFMGPFCMSSCCQDLEILREDVFRALLAEDTALLGPTCACGFNCTRQTSARIRPAQSCCRCILAGLNRTSDTGCRSFLGGSCSCQASRQLKARPHPLLTAQHPGSANLLVRLQRRPPWLGEADSGQPVMFWVVQHLSSSQAQLPLRIQDALCKLWRVAWLRQTQLAISGQWTH